MKKSNKSINKVARSRDSFLSLHLTSLLEKLSNQINATLSIYSNILYESKMDNSNNSKRKIKLTRNKY